MLPSLKVILDIQELDMKMIRLVRLKKERLNELSHIDALRQELQAQLKEKGQEITSLSQDISINENRIVELKEKLKKLEARQSSVKKVEEFNALTQEISTAERERVNTEHATSDLIDKRNMEEELLDKIKKSLVSSEERSVKLEEEIKSSIATINAEGKEIKTEREKIAATADQDVLRIYEKLLNNKRDRIVVPIENRICSGCHIALTAHYENLVRRGERLTFCEHCSRILYWPESEVVTTETVKRRRRRAS